MLTDKKTNQKTGLTSEEAERSRAEHGDNTLSRKKRKSFISDFFSNLSDPVIKILLLALGVNLVFSFFGGDILETIGIGISVLLATLISTLSERGSQGAFERLSAESGELFARVRRDGEVLEIPISDIVVGDTVLVSSGDAIPADGYVISGRLGIDQSPMTGESREVEKLPSSDITTSPDGKSSALRGCSVLTGEGELLIFATGDNTFLGGISREVQTDTRESPLKIRLSVLAKQISRLGYIAAALVAVAYLFNILVIDTGADINLILSKISDLPYIFDKLLHALMLGLTVIVVAVPEGLPMMIAVVLSANIRRMVKDNVLVKKPVGIEAAGSMNILFTDKTGTLTEGKMTVGSIIFADGEEFSSPKRLPSTLPSRLYTLCALYNTSSVISGGRVIGGNATDRALAESVRTEAPLNEPSGVHRQALLPFDSDKKISAASFLGAPCAALVKGAPEKLMPYLEYAYDSKGKICSYAAIAESISQKIHALTSRGGRVIVIAEAPRLPEGRHMPPLTFVCAVMLEDKIRRTARASVRELCDAGIQVVMITGDARETAKSIARETGILTHSKSVTLSSEELSALSDREVTELLPRLAVVCRALPTDKSRLVRIAQERELVVGMTGDGINDAPALKLADIGFSMGSGTHVAKEAGDIIILDNNLASISKAVLYGRTIFKSIRKFITLQLTMNFSAVGVSMIGPFVGIDAPVTVVQMLWINIIMDTLGGLAFAGEAPLLSYMKEKPKRRDEPILNPYMINQIVLLGGFTIGLCMAFLLLPAINSHFRTTEGNICLLTAFFALFIFTSVFNCFNARTDRLKIFSGLGKNRVFMLIMLLVCTVQIIFVFLGGSLLRTMPLTADELGFTLLLSLSVFPFELLRKLIWRLMGKGGKEGF